LNPLYYRWIEMGTRPLPSIRVLRELCKFFGKKPFRVLAVKTISMGAPEIRRKMVKKLFPDLLGELF